MGVRSLGNKGNDWKRIIQMTFGFGRRLCAAIGQNSQSGNMCNVTIARELREPDLFFWNTSALDVSFQEVVPVEVPHLAASSRRCEIAREVFHLAPIESLNQNGVSIPVIHQMLRIEGETARIHTLRAFRDYLINDTMQVCSNRPAGAFSMCSG